MYIRVIRGIHLEIRVEIEIVSRMAEENDDENVVKNTVYEMPVCFIIVRSWVVFNVVV